MDLKLGPDHDLAFVDNDLVATKTLDESLAQRLLIKLQTFQGEWFLDVEEGVPYFQSIFGKNRSKESVDAIFQREITTEPEVVSLDSYQSILDSEYRVFSLSFQITSVNQEEPTLIEIDIGG